MKNSSCQVRNWALVWKCGSMMTGTFRLTAREALERWTTARLAGHNEVYIGRMSETWVMKVASVWSRV